MEQQLFAQLKNFYAGYSPLAHLDSLTEKGSAGSASAMVNCDILNGGYLQQGPGLATLTDGTEAGAITELVNYILDIPPVDGFTFGISATKLHKISPTAVINASPFPQAITSAVSGKSVAYLKGGLYYFFTRAADGAIGTYNLDATFNHAWQTGLQKADLYPVAVKEDIMLFGHGRYVGVYFQSTASMNLTRLDFGTNNEVADIVFHGNQWVIAVNGGLSGTNRNLSNIYTYAGGATTALLSDEASIGVQKIGFLFPLTGIIYVAYQDLSFAGGYKIGFLAGREIKPLAHFQGSLPTYAQKTLFKNTILFISGGAIYSAGAVVGELPFAISQYMDAGFSTVGAIACPFGDILVASTQSTFFKLAKNSGYDTACSWRSVVIPAISGKYSGFIDFIVVRTNTLGSGAAASLKLEIDQASTTTDAYAIATTGKRKHIRNINKACDDFRILIDFATGSTSNPCQIKSIDVWGHLK